MQGGNNSQDSTKEVKDFPGGPVVKTLYVQC